jgi:hypothetical protein
MSTTIESDTIDALLAMPHAVQKLLKLKGQFVRIAIKREMKTRKGMPTIIKSSKLTVRIGVDYSNIASVKEKRENGDLPSQEESTLPWGHWVDGLFPYVIEHKGEYYVRCTVVNNPNSHSETHYFINGQEKSRDEIESMCLASEFKDRDDLDVFNVKMSNLVAINNEMI